MNTPHLIEIALLMLAAFLIGCLIGYFLRRIISGGTPASTISATSSNDTQSSTTATSAAASAATSAVKKDEPTPVKDNSGSAKTPAKKPAAKRVAAAKTTTAKATPTKKAVKPAAKAAPKKSTTSKTAGAPDGKPEVLSAPRDGAKDNLKNIKGVGPKIEGTLNDMGIYHYDQIAAWSRKEVKWVDEELSFKGRIDREKWIAQAKTLSKGS